MFARTERTLLRPAWIEDAPSLQNAIADEAIVRNLVMAPWPYNLDDAQNFVHMNHNILTPNFMIMRRTDDAPILIGSCGLLSRNGQIELGYWIARQYWGMGYASEAAKAVLHIAHSLGHKQIYAGYFTDNPASGRVLQKLGFQPSGPKRKIYSLGRGCEADLLPMKINNLSDILTHEVEGAGHYPSPSYYDAQKIDKKAA